MVERLKDALPVTAALNDEGHLSIGGRDAVSLAEEFGTPLFVFCEQTLRTRAQEFRKAFPDATVYYAAKAFLCLQMCDLVEREGLNLDVASGGELNCALTAGFPPERMVLHGNNKQPAELRRAVGCGIGRVALDNLEEVRTVAAIAAEKGRRQPVVVRVTPGVEAHTHEYIQTGQEDSKFGLSIQGGLAEQAVALVQQQPSLQLAGIHVHIGSNIFSYGPFGKTIEVLFGFAAEMKQKLGADLSEFNLGGGFGIPHLAGDRPVQLDLLAESVEQALADGAAKYSLAPPKVCFEPGRFLVGNAMVTLYRTGVIKRIPDVRTYLSVDGGMSDNIRPALYRAKYTALVANKAADPASEVVTVAGLHCESGDILVKDVALAGPVATGDILAVPATGAYGYSMASNYNMQPRPAVVRVNNGQASLMVRRESPDDLLRLHEPRRG